MYVNYVSQISMFLQEENIAVVLAKNQNIKFRSEQSFE